MLDRIELIPTRPEDESFLLRVYGATRMEELAMTSWDDAQRQSFVQMQYAAQRCHYDKDYPEAARSVITVDGQPVGRLIVDRTVESLHIIDISLLPERRGRGIGTAVLEQLIAEADAADRPVEICVEKFNRAQRLYQRLGFARVEDLGVYLRLKRPAKSNGERHEVTAQLSAR